ncbi:MAG: nitroreductase family deazaflavin-dependent oxidoreductase [Acidimicrobiaceae bacterium]|nr:nitroreductase family deazaflavin-dependent oxidoreductase [Acidimicrobiaceae bacterium]
MEQTHYQKPDWITKHIFNPTVAGLTRMGYGWHGARVLETKGRSSGEPRRNPVNPLKFDGHEYLVAPRGETGWVRNVRADNGHLALIKGNRREERTATEVPAEERVPILREYLKHWKAETGRFFGVKDDATNEELAAIADRHPVFRLD